MSFPYSEETHTPFLLRSIQAHAKAKRENAEADRLAAEAKRIAQVKPLISQSTPYVALPIFPSYHSDFYSQLIQLIHVGGR